MTHTCIEGVIVIKKDFNLAKHPDVEPAVPNLQAIKALLSLKSRGYVTENFSWQYYYYVLTEEGIAFLRKELSLPETVVPATVAKAMRSGANANERRPGGDRERRPGGPRPSQEGGGYRRRGEEDEKKVGASADFKPEFVSQKKNRSESESE